MPARRPSCRPRDRRGRACQLSARVRVFSTGQGRKTDATDAHSIAVVARRTPGLRAVRVDSATVALRLLVDRRDELGRGAHVEGQPVSLTASRADPGWDQRPWVSTGVREVGVRD